MHPNVIEHSYSIVVTQDCDLEQDFAARFPEATQENSPDKLLFGILLCGAYDELLMKAGRHRISSKTFSRQEWKAVKKNQDPRYQYLGAIPGLPTKMVVDFKDFFMVPCELIYREIENGSVTRAVEMNSPYKEHVLQRFAWYLMRVGLPKDFDQLIEVARIISEPSTAQQQPAVNADFTAPIVTAPEVATQPQSDGSTTTPTGKEPEPSTE